MSEGKTLGNQLQILSGFPFPSTNFTSERGGDPVIRIRDLQQQNPETYFCGNYDSSFLVSKGDILVGMDGDFNAVKWLGPRALLNQRVCKISTRDPVVLDQEFLYHSLQPQLDRIHKGTAQTTVKHLSTKDIYGIDTELPPLSEQKKIAEILSGIDRCIQAKRLRVNKADNIMRAMKEALMTWEEDWQEFELGELLTFRNGLNTEKENFGRGVPFVSYKDVYAGGIVNSKMLKQRVSLSAVEEERFSLQSGDILFTRTSETPEEIGFTCVFDDKHGSAVFNGFCIRGRLLEKGKLMPEFASFYLRSEYVLTQMRFLCKYTTRAGISAESLSQVRVHIPDQETQKRLADSLLAINRYRAAQEEAIKNLKSIKKAVSADLLSGRKRVPL
jgi:type I restriction enzyme, S subunit